MKFLITRRLPIALFVVLAGSVLAFLVPRLAPGDPAAAIVGQNAPHATYEAVRAELGLDLPLWQQYLKWFGNVLQGNLGTSYYTHRPVAELIGDRLEPTVELALAGLIIMLLAGFALASWGATSRRKGIRHAIDGGSSVLLAIPAFLIGIGLIVLFGIVWPVLPVSGTVTLSENFVVGLQYLLLPAITVAIVPTVVFVRIVQSQMLGVKSEDYVATAIAKGLRPRLVNTRYIRANALGPAIVVAGVIFGELLGGAVVVENIFGRDGLGQLAVTSVANRDYMVTQTLIFGALLVAVCVQLVSEFLQALTDPRVRIDGGA